MTKESLVHLSAAVIGYLCVAVRATAPLSAAPDDIYPNELPAFKFFATARWNVLRPLISTQAEAFALLGPPQPVTYDIDDNWKLIIMYVGEGSCDGKPWPGFLEGRVSDIQLMPKHRVSLSGVRFPSAFKRSDGGVTHHIIDSVVSYKDAYGLEYELWGDSSKDGSIQVGDLKAIIYGPSRKLFSSMTGCEP